MSVQVTAERVPLLALLVQAGRQAHVVAEEAATDGGLRYDLWAVLDLLHDRGRCSMAEIAEALVVPPPTLTRTVDRLIADGFVHRLSDPSDRRRVLVLPTRRGVAKHAEMAAAVVSASALLTRNLTERQRDELTGLLAAVVGAAPDAGPSCR